MGESIAVVMFSVLHLNQDKTFETRQMQYPVSVVRHPVSIESQRSHLIYKSNPSKVSTRRIQPRL